MLHIFSYATLVSDEFNFVSLVKLGILCLQLVYWLIANDQSMNTNAVNISR